MTIRLDFGRLFPGLLIFLIGVGFFVLSLVFILLSFFAFFIFDLHWIFYFTLDLLVASLVIMGSGGIIMMADISGWRHMMGTSPEEERKENRLGGFVAKRAYRDKMRLSERAGEIFGLFVSIFVILFFIANQDRGTGFFTPAFGLHEQLLFYGSWLAGAAVALTRAVYGKRNGVRPLEALAQALFAIAAVWFLIVFPFNFAHLPDLLPATTRFAFFWVTNEVGALVLMISVIAATVSSAYALVLYVAIRDWQMKKRVESSAHFKAEMH